MLYRFITISLSVAVLTACATHSDNNHTSKNTALTPSKPTVALVLGGGGTRGFAHVGVIDTLEKHGIQPDLIVGSSAGAVVGSLYASGKTPDELLKLSQTLQMNDIIDFTPSKQGLIEGRKLRTYINNHVNHQPIEKLPTRFAAVATKAKDKQTVVFSQGETGLAVQASSSVPSLFIAPRIPENTGEKYIDGSVSALLPARVARSMGADVVISVDVMSQNKTNNTPANATIRRTPTGIEATWGHQNFEIPLELPKTTDQTLPFELPVDAIFQSILKSMPEHLQIPIPKHLPAELPNNPKDAWAILVNLGSNSQADAADIAASNVVISVDASEIAVFDMNKKQELIDAGRQAAEIKIDAIKKAIANAQYHRVGTVQ